MIPFGETTEDLERKLEVAREALAGFERSVTDRALFARIRRASPCHPTLVARGCFLFWTLCILTAAAAFVILPYLARELASLVGGLQQAIPILPIPVALVFAALFTAIAWFLAGRAAIAIARDKPLLDEERAEYERLASEVERLDGQRALLERARKQRTATPAPLHPTAGGAVSRLLVPTGEDTNPLYSAPDEPSRVGAASRFRSEPASSRATPAGAMPRSAGRGARGVTPPGLQRREAQPGASATYAPSRTDPEITEHTSPFISGEMPIGSEDDPNFFGQPFEQRCATRFPEWGEINEAWLGEAIELSTQLAAEFPIQARLEFSLAPGLPFTLALDRPSRATAVAAVAGFADFLSRIPVVPRARVDLRDAANLDPTFDRNVRAAFIPFFEALEIRHMGDAVEVGFLHPDARWARFPFLPILRR